MPLRFPRAIASGFLRIVLLCDDDFLEEEEDVDAKCDVLVEVEETDAVNESDRCIIVCDLKKECVFLCVFVCASSADNPRVCVRFQKLVTGAKCKKKIFRVSKSI